MTEMFLPEVIITTAIYAYQLNDAVYFNVLKQNVFLRGTIFHTGPHGRR